MNESEVTVRVALWGVPDSGTFHPGREFVVNSGPIRFTQELVHGDIVKVRVDGVEPVPVELTNGVPEGTLLIIKVEWKHNAGWKLCGGLWARQAYSRSRSGLHEVSVLAAIGTDTKPAELRLSGYANGGDRVLRIGRRVEESPLFPLYDPRHERAS